MKIYKSIKLSLIFVMAALLFSSCEKIFMEANPETDNVSIYEEFWTLVDEKYAMWDNPDKKLDKEAIHTYTRSLVTEDMSKDSLFNVLGYIVQQLKDGHTWLQSKEDGFLSYYDIEALDDPNYDEDVINNVYLQGDYKTLGAHEILKYRLIHNGEIAYVSLTAWADEYTDEELDEMLNYFAGTKGLIFDVRENGGGDPFSAVQVARRFTDKEYFVGTEYFKTGPGPKDFSPNKLYIKPTDFVSYNKPLMVLTNRLCFSATTTFIYYLNPLPQVKTIGRRTGGGSGSTADNFLANGWHWQMSTSEFIDLEGRHLDNGIDPDINVQLDTLNTSQDEIIERAIQEILSAK